MCLPRAQQLLIKGTVGEPNRATRTHVAAPEDGAGSDLPIYVIRVRGVFGFCITIRDGRPVDAGRDAWFEFSWEFEELTMPVTKEHVISASAPKIMPGSLRVVDVTIGMP